MKAGLSLKKILNITFLFALLVQNACRFNFKSAYLFQIRVYCFVVVFFYFIKKNKCIIWSFHMKGTHLSCQDIKYLKINM